MAASNRFIRSLAALAALLAPFWAGASDFPALCIEVSAERPLYLFRVSDPGGGDSARYAEQVLNAWNSLPEPLKPYAAIEIDPNTADATQRQTALTAMLGALQTADVPVVVVVADGRPQHFSPTTDVEALLQAYTCVKGISVSGLRFNIYDPFDTSPALPAPGMVRWLCDTVDLAARYGRFAWIALDEIGWPRVMANVSCASLYAKMRECRDYVFAGVSFRGPHTIPQISAAMGLWLEGAVAQWGVAPDSRWYADARFDGLGRYGGTGGAEKAPATLYRAMILDGAMTGAAVYAFPEDRDLWLGVAQHHWAQAIAPTLTELVEKGLIPRQEFVRKRIRVAYQLGQATSPTDFHRNLHDIDGVLDQGLLMHGVYGMERPGQVPELVPNRGNAYWIPILSAWAPAESLQGFGSVVQPDRMGTPKDWSDLLEEFYEAKDEGTAFSAQIGRGMFAMNSRENEWESQNVRFAEAPAPVRGLVARREGEGIALSWPFREGDVSYKVYRRVLPQTEFTLLANGLDQRRYTDTPVPPEYTVAYAVTALTNETEPFEDILDYGEFLVLSTVESRIAEEALLSPVQSYAESAPLQPPVPPAVPATSAWPDYTGVQPADRAAADAIVQRIDGWDRAVGAGDLNGVMDLYSTEYQDPQGWGLQYVRRAYQWFFEGYAAPRFHRQARQWDFTSYAVDRTARLLLYCRLTAVAVSDSSGRVADTPVSVPATGTSECWITFTDRDGFWRILRTEPAFPNMKELLSYSAGAFDGYQPGPDAYAPKPPTP